MEKVVALECPISTGTYPLAEMTRISLVEASASARNARQRCVYVHEQVAEGLEVRDVVKLDGVVWLVAE